MVTLPVNRMEEREREQELVNDKNELECEENREQSCGGIDERYAAEQDRGHIDIVDKEGKSDSIRDIDAGKRKSVVEESKVEKMQDMSFVKFDNMERNLRREIRACTVAGEVWNKIKNVTSGDIAGSCMGRG